MTQFGTALKPFAQLTDGEHIYYLDPKEPGVVKSLIVREVNPLLEKKYWVTVEYYQSSQALAKTTDESRHIVPTKKLVMDGRLGRMMTLSMPPTVYYTNKRELEKFIGIR